MVCSKTEAAMIESILDGREKRFNVQNRMLCQYKHSIVSATINYPGNSKVNKHTCLIFDEMLRSFEIFDFEFSLIDINGGGYCMIGSIDMMALELKKQMVLIENEHPLGRVFDIDVIAYPYHKISRVDIKEKKRKCLICSMDAEVCIHEQRHSVQEIKEKINELIEAFQ